MPTVSTALSEIGIAEVNVDTLCALVVVQSKPITAAGRQSGPALPPSPLLLFLKRCFGL